MAKAIIPRQHGEELQGRFFWYKASLLYLQPNVKSVGYEVDGVRAFDDVAVRYDPPAIDDQTQELITADYYQLKFHATHAGAVTAESFTDPEFIGATSTSLLERLKDAQERHAPTGSGVRFTIVLQWHIHPDDVLAKIVRQADGRLDVEKLRIGGPKSEMGRLRTKWMKHLQITSVDDLVTVLSPFRVREVGHLDAFKEEVSTRLQLAGWKPMTEPVDIHTYDDLPRKLLQSGKQFYDAGELRAIGMVRGVWLRAPFVAGQPGRAIGIRSFATGAEDIPQVTESHLCLLELYEDRWPKNDDWDAIAKTVQQYLAEVSVTKSPIHLHLPTNGAIAFMAGRHFDSKKGIPVYPVQRSFGREPEVWVPIISDRANTELWNVVTEDLGTGPDVAIAVAVTHDISDEVTDFVTANCPEIGRVLTLRVLPGPPSSTAIRDASHAFALAQSAVARIREGMKDAQRNAAVHLFFAAPCALMFFMGQHGQVLGRSVTYEHDFKRKKQVAYARAITIE